MAIRCGSAVIIISFVVPIITTLLISLIYRKKTKYWLIIGGASGFLSGIITLFWFIKTKEDMWIDDGTECPPLDVEAYMPVLLIPLIIIVVLEIILLWYLSKKSEAEPKLADNDLAETQGP